MANRFDNLDAIAEFLHKRYLLATQVLTQVNEYEKAADYDKAQAIVNDPAYRKNIKFTYTLRELANARINGLYYQQLYYALVATELSYVNKGEQPPSLLERGISTAYSKRKNGQEYSYSPHLVSASMVAKMQPNIVITPPDAISVAPNQISVVPSNSPTGNNTSAPPVGDNPPTISERERKILDVFERCYAEAGPMFKAAFDNALVDPKEVFMPGVLVAAYIEVTGIEIGEIVSKEEYLAKSVSARKLTAYLK